MPLGVDRGQQQLILIKHLEDLLDLRASEDALELPGLPLLEIKLQVIPVSVELIKLLLDTDLLVSGIADILDVFDVLEEVGVEEIGHLEEIFLLVWNVVARNFDNTFPMALFDRVLLELSDQREDFPILIDLLLQFKVSLPGLQILREGGALLTELLDLVLPLLEHVYTDFGPELILPVAQSNDNLAIEVIQLLQVLEFALDLLKLGVLLVRQSEEVLTGEIDIELPLDHLVLELEVVES